MNRESLIADLNKKEVSIYELLDEYIKDKKVPSPYKELLKHPLIIREINYNKLLTIFLIKYNINIVLDINNNPLKYF